MKEVDLKEIYAVLYETIPWPKPIPRPEEMMFQWSNRMISTDGKCFWVKKLIVINSIFQDESLQGELVDLMAHEMAHLIWRSHSYEFSSFLLSIGVSESYAKASGSTQTSIAAYHKHRPYRYVWECPACHKVVYTHQWITSSCAGCDKKWNPKYRFRLVEDRKQKVMLGTNMRVSR